MKTWIALFRGINVGGNNLLPMAELRNDLESLKLKHVRTYIQSGNVVFQSNAKTASSLSKKIRTQVEKQHGFKPQVLVLSCEDLQAAIQSNPFPDATAHPKTLHFFFLEKPATDPDIDALNNAKSPAENFRLTDRVFFLHSQDGFARSKLASNVEKYLGVVVTARNYRTVEKLASMAEQETP